MRINSFFERPRGGGLPVENNQENRKNFQFEGGSIPSEKHPNSNEDNFFFDNERMAFGVFDGIGGHAGGREASERARNYLRNALTTIPPDLAPDEISNLISHTLEDANKMILRKARGSQAQDMGTTASVGYIHEDQFGKKKLIVGNVGDSRVYVVRNGKMHQITLDDNLVRYESDSEEHARQIQSHLNNAANPAVDLTSQEKELFRGRNQITQYLGGDSIRPRMQTIDLLSSDRLLVCSDGISDNLTDTEIEDIFSKASDIQAAVPDLINAAHNRSLEKVARSKSDDMTAVVAEIDVKKSIAKNKKPERLPEERIFSGKGFQKGDEVLVRRSDGTIEGGWTVSGHDGERYIVTKESPGGGKIAKNITHQDLEMLNKRVEKSDLENVINSRKELFEYLRNLGGIRGSNEYYDSDQLVEIAEGILEGKIAINGMTSKGGLRGMVARVRDMEKIGKLRGEIAAS